MEHEHHGHHGVSATALKDYWPLLVLTAYIVAGTALLTVLVPGANWMRTAMFFEGLMLVFFALFKLINVRGFQEGYAMYDLIAQRVPAWGLLFPFVEFGLGALLLTNTVPLIAGSAVAVLALIGLVGVSIELRKDRKIQCACMGTALNVPLTYVTLIENAVMLVMASMIVWYL